MSSKIICVFVLILAAGGSLRADDTALSPRNFASIQRLIRPQPDESQWASVPWLSNLKEARERAAREDKPLFLWRSGGGDVLGRT
ncbi:MAG: hypothetical protein ACI9HK_001889 [Pirellulaceae bacterium]|jgi:hypothetical protein